MTTTSYTAARSNLAQTMQKVCDDHAPIIITRSNAEPVVMLSLSDFEALQETNYLIRSPANASRLIEAIDEIEALVAADKEK
jgi:antitoxin YefM